MTHHMATKKRAKRAPRIPGGRLAMRRLNVAIDPMTGTMLDQLCEEKRWTHRRAIESAIQLYILVSKGDAAAVLRDASGEPTSREVPL